jgi:hypothetical protein
MDRQEMLWTVAKILRFRLQWKRHFRLSVTVLTRQFYSHVLPKYRNLRFFFIFQERKSLEICSSKHIKGLAKTTQECAILVLTDSRAQDSKQTFQYFPMSTTIQSFMFPIQWARATFMSLSL